MRSLSEAWPVSFSIARFYQTYLVICSHIIVFSFVDEVTLELDIGRSLSNVKVCDYDTSSPNMTISDDSWLVWRLVARLFNCGFLIHIKIHSWLDVNIFLGRKWMRSQTASHLISKRYQVQLWRFYSVPSLRHTEDAMAIIEVIFKNLCSCLIQKFNYL